MDIIKTSILALAISVAVAIGFAVFDKEDGLSLGALSSPEIMSNWFSVGGVREWKYSAAPTAASYTLCSFQSPAATSTIKSAGISLTVSTTSASTLYIAKGATAVATTTLLGSAYAIGASAQATVIASTTPWEAGSAAIIAPNQYVNIALNPAASVITNLAPQGRCQVVFEEYLPL